MTRANSVDEAMAVGTARYADVIAAHGAAGLPRVFTQTGGLSAALEVTLETGQHLLITDAEDSLSWVRGVERGWGVGRYVTDSEYDDGPLMFCDSANTDTGTPLAVASRAVGVWNSRGYRRHQCHHGTHEPSKGYRMTTAEEHRSHEHADHVHGEGCGHEAVQHGDHLDYLHDGHRHAEHEGHYDEHGEA